MNKNGQSGFTLYELLITIVVLGVILAIGLPNLSNIWQNSRMAGAANDILGAFQVARSEAARAKTNITICASANPMAADADCGGTWGQGYIVFVDDNADAARAGPAETVLRAQPALPDTVTLAVADDARYFMFAATGLGRLDTAGDPALSRVVMCDERGNSPAAGGDSAARLFIATPLGRTTILRDRASIGEALAAIGTSCP